MSSALEEALAALEAGDDGAVRRLLRDRPGELLSHPFHGPAFVRHLTTGGYRELLIETLTLDMSPAEKWIGSAKVEELSAFHYGDSLLDHLIAAGQTDLIRVLLARGVSPDQGMAEIPLHQAAFLGRADIVEALLDFGADVDQQDRYHATAILTAACAGHFAVVATLLKRGADPNVIEICGYSTALSLAAQQGR